MTVSLENGGSRGGGSILIVGAATEEILPVVRALESLAETTLVPPAEALAALSRLDADVLVVEERDRELPAEPAALRPPTGRTLLRSADGAADRPDAETAVLPPPLPAP